VLSFHVFLRALKDATADDLVRPELRATDALIRLPSALAERIAAWLPCWYMVDPRLSGDWHPRRVMGARACSARSILKRPGSAMYTGLPSLASMAVYHVP